MNYKRICKELIGRVREAEEDLEERLQMIKNMSEDIKLLFEESKR